MNSLYRKRLLDFGLSTVVLLIGLLFLAVGAFGKIIMNTAGLDFISFGILCTLTGFTGYNDTLLLQVLTRHPALIRVITYACLIFIPYPALSFFASATGNSRSRLVPASLVLCLGNFAAQLLLTHGTCLLLNIGEEQVILRTLIYAVAMVLLFILSYMIQQRWVFAPQKKNHEVEKV